MRELIRHFICPRDVRITAQIEAMATDIEAFDFIEPEPFLNRERASIIARRDQLSEEMEDRHRQIEDLEANIAELRTEIAERFRVAGALSRALDYLADNGLPVAAE